MEAEEFAETLSMYEGQLISYANTILADMESARDAVQDTFLKLWNQQEKLCSIKPWLYTTCRNRCIDILRKNRRIVSIDSAQLETHESPSPRPDQSAAAHDQHSEILSHFEELSANQREVIRLRFDADLSYREISAITGLSEGNVGFQLHTGLKKLRTLINSPRPSAPQSPRETTSKTR